MITVAEYLGFVFKEIIHARVLADSESLRVAEEYAKNEVTRQMSVPRFKIPEITLDLPVVVSGADYKNILALKITQANFVKAVKTNLNSILIAFNSKILFTPRVHTKLQKVVKLMGDMYQELNVESTAENYEAAINEKLEVLHKYGNEIFETTIKICRVNIEDPKLLANWRKKKLVIKNFINTDTKIVKRKVDTNFFKIDTKKRSLLGPNDPEGPGALDAEEVLGKDATPRESFLHYINSTFTDNYKIIDSELKNLMVNPETNIVKETGTDLSILKINAKIIEEGIFVETVTDENGTETKIVNFE